MCFCLKTTYLICIVDSLTLNSEPTTSQLMPEYSSSNTYFLQSTAFCAEGHQTAFPCYTCGHFKQRNCQHKAQKCVCVWGDGTEYQQTLVCTIKTKTEKQNATL